jgi:hypothetical protein
MYAEDLQSLNKLPKTRISRQSISELLLKTLQDRSVGVGRTSTHEFCECIRRALQSDNVQPTFFIQHLPSPDASSVPSDQHRGQSNALFTPGYNIENSRALRSLKGEYRRRKRTNMPQILANAIPVSQLRSTKSATSIVSPQ